MREREENARSSEKSKLMEWHRGFMNAHAHTLGRSGFARQQQHFVAVLRYRVRIHYNKAMASRTIPS